MADVAVNAADTLRVVASEHGLAPSEATFSDGSVSRPLGWLEFTDRASTLHAYAEVDLCDAANYYGGYKAPLVLKFESVTRSMSDRMGQPQHMRFGVLLSDTARTFRSLLGDASTKYITNRPLEVRVIDDEARRTLGIPRLVANGYVSDYSPDAQLKFKVTGADWLKKKFTRKKDSQNAWQPTITLADFPDAGDSLEKSVPIIYGSLGLTGASSVAGVTITPAARPGAPSGLSAAFSAGGGTFGDYRDIGNGETLFYAVTAVVAGIESDPAYASATSTSAAGHVTVSWSAYAGASAYRVYVSYRSDFMQFSQLTTDTASTSVTDITGGTRPDVNALDIWSMGLRMNVTYYVWAKLSATTWSSPGQATTVFTPITNGDRRRDMTVSWTAYGGATAYRVVRYVSFYSSWGPRFDLQFDVSSATTSVSDVANSDSLIPGGYANAPGISIPSGTSIAQPLTGAVQAVFVGSETINGRLYKRLLVAGHACKRIGRIDYSNTGRGTDAVATNSTTYTRATSFGGDWLSPDETGWPFASRYRDINGHRYTLIYTSQEPLSDKILVDVDGIETVGDGSGTLITQLHRQYLHFLQNWIAPDTAYVNGSWLGTTYFTAEPTLSLIDAASFATAETAASERVSGGYEGATVIGAGGEAVGVFEALARWNVSGGCDSYFNRKGQYAISMEPITPPTTITSITDVFSMNEGTFSITDEVTQNFFTILQYAHTRDYTGLSKRGWISKDEGESELRDEASITNYQQEIASPEVQVHCARGTSTQGAATISDVLYRLLARLRDPRRRVSLTVPLSGLSVEVGDVLALDSIEGIGASGWTNHRVRVVGHEARLSDGDVVLDCYDIEDLFQRREIWASDPLAIQAGVESQSLFDGTRYLITGRESLRVSATEVATKV